MASRMERYHEERSTRNEQLYKNIENLDNYTNIEGVIAIDKTNEIDITKVKEMLQGRESYQKEKQYRNLVEEEESSQPVRQSVEEEEKSYDIKNVLNRAKETRQEPEESYRTLKNMNYDVRQRIKVRTTPDQEEVLKELIDTVSLKRTTTQAISNVSEESGLLDDLKSDTMVGDPSSIKKIIEEAKQEEEKQKEEKKYSSKTTNLEDIDKTFYTSSLGFTDKDFEDLKDLGENIKKRNILLRILVIAVVIVIIVAVIFLVLHFLNQ